MMDQVCNEIKRVLLAGVGLADKGIQKVGQGVNSLSQHGEEVWQKLTAKQKCASCPQDEIDELLSSLSPSSWTHCAARSMSSRLKRLSSRKMMKTHKAKSRLSS